MSASRGSCSIWGRRRKCAVGRGTKLRTGISWRGGESPSGAAVAAVAIVVYLTGEPAEELVENLAGIPEPALEAHEDAALTATIGFGIFGAAALGMLLIFRRRARAKEWNVLTQRTVAEAMTRTVRWLSPDAEVHRTASVLTDEGIHRVLVMEETRTPGRHAGAPPGRDGLSDGGAPPVKGGAPLHDGSEGLYYWIVD